jgi:hypothetical protein
VSSEFLPPGAGRPYLADREGPGQPRRINCQDIVAIVPTQLLAYHLASGRGRDTEAAHGISKVTLTR